MTSSIYEAIDHIDQKRFTLESIKYDTLYISTFNDLNNTVIKKSKNLKIAASLLYSNIERHELIDNLKFLSEYFPSNTETNKRIQLLLQYLSKSK